MLLCKVSKTLHIFSLIRFCITEYMWHSLLYFVSVIYLVVSLPAKFLSVHVSTGRGPSFLIVHGEIKCADIK